jgi:CBS domain-containing membrane protein
MIASASLTGMRPKVLRLSTAAELMTANPLSFQQGDALHKVAALLKFHELEAAPVVDCSNRLVGLVSAHACAVWEEFSRRSSPHGFSAADLHETDISEIVSPVVKTVPENASGEDVLEMFAQGHARRIYVVDANNELVGVISMTDMLRRLRDGSGAKRVHGAAAALLC